jgi:large subunit ribosomal protein L9
MEVIFIKDLKGQGKVNQLKEVSDGYAMNFLIPNGYAVQATPGKVETLKVKIKVQNEEDKLGKAETEQQKRTLEGLSLVFKLNFSNTDKAQGSITAKDIVDELKSKYKLDLSTKNGNNEC